MLTFTERRKNKLEKKRVKYTEKKLVVRESIVLTRTLFVRMWHYGIANMKRKCQTVIITIQFFHLYAFIEIILFANITWIEEMNTFEMAKAIMMKEKTQKREVSLRVCRKCHSIVVRKILNFQRYFLSLSPSCHGWRSDGILEQKIAFTSHFSTWREFNFSQCRYTSQRIKHRFST